MSPSLSAVSLERIPGAVPAWRGATDAPGWRGACEEAAIQGGRLGALWASDDRERSGSFVLHALLVLYEGVVCVDLAVGTEEFPDLSDLFPAAGRMQRAVRDLVGLRAGQDSRGWLRHGGWREDHFPLRRDAPLNAALAPGDARYSFVAVEGEGVHEIAVGPVHAGIIEPGHFRFSVVGERVLKLEERLGYTHKGIEKRFESMSVQDASRLAARVSGDSTVAFGWAYSMAVESVAGVVPAPRALWLRALLLERERIANHLGDLGYLGNDGGLAFGLAQFSRLKEDVLRVNGRLFGHRYLMDRIVPGGVEIDVDSAAVGEMLAEADRLDGEIETLRAIYYDHPGLQDRFVSCGRLEPRTAASLGVVGLAARASGLAMDSRIFPGFAPYAELRPALCSHRNGDVAARAIVRFEELGESLTLQRRILRGLPESALKTALPEPAEGAFGIGWVEGWRGEVFVALQTGPQGTIRRCHPHDPSWQNWPALEHAIIGNIVPDFPLINKSFNLSYAGADL
jgi:Ni,Fe-hydrogenase III large subunit